MTPEEQAIREQIKRDARQRYLLERDLKEQARRREAEAKRQREQEQHEHSD